MTPEKKRIEDIAGRSRYAEGLNEQSTRYSYAIFQRYMKPGPVLELGPAEGIMTECLVEACQDLTVVEGASVFCKNLRERFPTVQVVNCLFEDFQPEVSFESVLLGHVLEHVDGPAPILSRVREWLTPTGKVFAAVPNARSLHRQAAVIMGLLKNENDLNENDIYHGHRRVYDPEAFRADFLAAGLNIEIFGGYWIKPLSNRQIEQTWTQEMVDAFMALGERYPEIAAELYVVASRRQ